jgi:GNAT superfamily N-acetyltransferase
MDTLPVGVQGLPDEASSNPELALSGAAGFHHQLLPSAITVVAEKASPSPHAVKIAIAISSPGTRRHILRVLSESEAEIQTKSWAELTDVVEIGVDQATVLDWLQRYFSDPGPTPLILISDLLKPPDDPLDGFLSRECERRFCKSALGTIAVLDPPTRMTDIDRTVGTSVVRDDFVYATVMVLSRIEYLMAPVKHQAAGQQPIMIRPLKNRNEAEFRSYFRLRHRVYSQMGYLEESTEQTPSKLEMNEADVHSIHLGAFCRSGCSESLVGSTRVVMNSDADPALIRLFEVIAANDRIAQQSLRKAYWLGLPIFHTFPRTTSIIKEIFRKKQKCGELSRVIVDGAFRGRGIANLLIAEALERAVGRGLTRIFLQCLKIHEPLYGKHGFKLMPGFEAGVIDVNRTVIAMELQPEAIARIAGNTY